MLDGRRVASWWLQGLLVSVVFWTLQAPVWSGRLAPRWDAATYYAPYFSLVADHARAGELLRWNPWTGSGSPDGFEPQIGAFSPFTVGLAALTGGTSVGFALYWSLGWWLGALGILPLARHLRAPPWAGTVASLAFATCGFFTAHATHTSFVIAFAVLPWMIWRLDAALTDGRLLPAVQAGALWGLAALSGYPAIIFLNALFAALWTFGRLLLPPGPGDSVRVEPRRARWVHGVACLALVALVGGVVLAPTYGGFFSEGGGYTDRTDPLPRWLAVGSNPFPVAAWPSLASPAFGGVSSFHRQLLDGSNPSLSNLYLAPLALLLALSGLRRDRPWRWGLLVVAAGFLAVATGPWLPLRGWLYDWLPPTRYFRHAGIFRGYALFAMIVLALEAARDLAEAGPHRRRQLGRLAGLAAAWAVVGTWGLLGVAADLPAPEPLLRIGVVMFLALTLAVAFWALWGRRKPPDARWVLLALALVTVDAYQAFTLSERLLGVGGRWSRFFVTMDRDHQPELHGTEPPERILRSLSPEPADDNHNLYTKQAVLAGYSTLINQSYGSWLELPTLRRRLLGPPRAWFAREALEVPPDKVWTLALAARGNDLPLLVHDRRSLLDPDDAADEPSPHARDVAARLAGAPPLRPLPTRYLDYGPNSLRLRVEVPTGGGWLWLPERFARGWRAWVDDREVEVRPANLVFRAVPVSAGGHEVRMAYRPAHLPWKVAASWGTLVLVALASAGRRFGPFRPRADRSGI